MFLPGKWRASSEITLTSAVSFSLQVNFENLALFLRLSLPSTLTRHENGALFLQLVLLSTLIRHENVALFLRLSLPSTLIRHENGALILRFSLPCTLIRHENVALFLRFKPTVHTNPSRKRSFSKTLSKREEFENAVFAF